MSLMRAFKAFFNAWKNPEECEKPSSLDHSHLRLLSMLQHAGRLIDFLKEDISDFSDAEVGACVRKIHADCGKFIEEMVTIRPLMDQEEGSAIEVREGYDPRKIKLVGNLKGQPPFKGTLMHKGWKAHKMSLTKKKCDVSDILYAAEVEVK